MRDYDEAAKQMQNLVEQFGNRGPNAKKVHDIYLQCFYRKAESLIEIDNYCGAIEQLEKLKSAFQSCPSELRDKRMKEKIANAAQLAQKCFQLSQIHDKDTKNNARRLFKWFAAEVNLQIALQTTNQIFIGSIIQLPVSKSYGFIETKDGERYFFHRNEIKDINEWPFMKIGTKVTFIKGMDRRGPSAVAVDILDCEAQTGEIVRIPYKQEYGFIRALDGKEYFFNFKSVISPKGAKPEIDNKVSFTFGENSSGICAVNVNIE